MDLIVETGVVVANANSYADIDYAREYAEARGVTLSSDDDVLGAQLIVGFDYINSLEARYQGYRVSQTQEGAWPRSYVVLNGYDFSETAIPKNIKNANVQLAMAQASGISVMPNHTAADRVIKEKIGPIETTYSDPSISGLSPTMTAVNALLEPLFDNGSGDFALRTVRV